MMTLCHHQYISTFLLLEEVFCVRRLMQSLRTSICALSRFERCLWLCSACVVSLSFFLGDASRPLTLVASLCGVTSLIFIAKGDVLGQFLTVAFSMLYAAVSLELRFYGEMITYLFMTLPSAVAAIVTWLRHPFEASKNEVAIAHLRLRDKIETGILTILVTFVFFFILRALNTANLPVSTVSIATSFLASYLLIKRSSFYALAYAANDIVLIVLWTMASTQSLRNLPMVFCFLMFLCNDCYAWYNWQRIQKRQHRVRQTDI